MTWNFPSESSCWGVADSVLLVSDLVIVSLLGLIVEEEVYFVWGSIYCVLCVGLSQNQLNFVWVACVVVYSSQDLYSPVTVFKGMSARWTCSLALFHFIVGYTFLALSFVFPRFVSPSFAPYISWSFFIFVCNGFALSFWGPQGSGVRLSSFFTSEETTDNGSVRLFASEQTHCKLTVHQRSFDCSLCLP